MARMPRDAMPCLLSQRLLLLLLQLLLLTVPLILATALDPDEVDPNTVRFVCLDGNTLLGADSQGKLLYIWRHANRTAAEQSPPLALSVPLENAEGMISAIAASRGFVYVASSAGQLQRWNYQQKRNTLDVQPLWAATLPHATEIVEIAIAPGDAFLYVRTSQNQLFKYEVLTGKMLIPSLETGLNLLGREISQLRSVPETGILVGSQLVPPPTAQSNTSVPVPSGSFEGISGTPDFSGAIYFTSGTMGPWTVSARSNTVAVVQVRKFADTDIDAPDGVAALWISTNSPTRPSFITSTIPGLEPETTYRMRLKQAKRSEDALTPSSFTITICGSVLSIPDTAITTFTPVITSPFVATTSICRMTLTVNGADSFVRGLVIDDLEIFVETSQPSYGNTRYSLVPSGDFEGFTAVTGKLFYSPIGSWRGSGNLRYVMQASATNDADAPDGDYVLWMKLESQGTVYVAQTIPNLEVNSFYRVRWFQARHVDFPSPTAFSVSLCGSVVYDGDPMSSAFKQIQSIPIQVTSTSCELRLTLNCALPACEGESSVVLDYIELGKVEAPRVHLVNAQDQVQRTFSPPIDWLEDKVDVARMEVTAVAGNKRHAFASMTVSPMTGTCTIFQWDLSSGEVVNRLKSDCTQPWQVLLSPRESALLAGSRASGGIAQWNLTSGRLSRIFGNNAHTSRLEALLYARPLLLSNDDMGKLSRWRMLELAEPLLATSQTKFSTPIPTKAGGPGQAALAGMDAGGYAAIIISTLVCLLIAGLAVYWWYRKRPHGDKNIAGAQAAYQPSTNTLAGGPEENASNVNAQQAAASSGNLVNPVSAEEQQPHVRGDTGESSNAPRKLRGAALPQIDTKFHMNGSNNAPRNPAGIPLPRPGPPPARPPPSTNNNNNNNNNNRNTNTQNATVAPRYAFLPPARPRMMARPPAASARNMPAPLGVQQYFAASVSNNNLEPDSTVFQESNAREPPGLAQGIAVPIQQLAAGATGTLRPRAPMQNMMRPPPGPYPPPSLE